MARIQVWAWRCDECGHQWLAGEIEPKQCGKCKSRKWNSGKPLAPAVTYGGPLRPEELRVDDGTAGTFQNLTRTPIKPKLMIDPAPDKDVLVKQLMARATGVLQVPMCAKHGQPKATCTGPTCRIDREERERRMAVNA